MMIHAKHLPIYFWAEALNTACHKHNRVSLRLEIITTSYELWKWRKPNVKYFHIFGSTCFILSDKEHHRKWDSKSHKGIFLGYSTNSQAYIVYNWRTRTVMESINVIIDDDEKVSNGSVDEDDGDIWALYSQKTKTSLSELSSLTDDKDNSSSHSNVDSMVVSIEPTSVGPFYPRLMHELIVNLPSDFNDLSVKEYQKVHIRGVCFNVSLELLNTFLGIALVADYAVPYPTPEYLAEELTGGTIRVWSIDGQLPVASLTVKYAILHRIGIANWIPSTHASTISTSLGHFVYLVGIRVKVNVV